MNGNIYKQINLTGTSSKSIEDAVNRAIQKASNTVRQMRWFSIDEVRGTVDGSSVAEWQVSIKVGFTLEE
jgi:flavin-binding protein dodecin